MALDYIRVLYIALFWQQAILCHLHLVNALFNQKNLTTAEPSLPTTSVVKVTCVQGSLSFITLAKKSFFFFFFFF